MNKLSMKSVEGGQNITTKKEKWGFYMFTFSNEPFVLSVAGLAGPLILEGLSAGAAYELDLVTPCNFTKHDYICKLKLGSIWMNTSSFTLYNFAITVVIQSLLFISIGAMADYGNLRKIMLFFSSTFSAVCLILLMAITEYQLFWLAALLIIFANVGFGASNIFYFSYLPILTSGDAEVLEVKDKDSSELIKIRERVSNDISAKGMSVGYVGGIIHLVISIITIIFMGNKGPVATFSMQLVAALCGAWILIFNIIPFFWLENRKGKTLPDGENYLFYSWKQMYITLKHILKLKQTIILLLSWFIMADTIHTFISMSALFGTKVLNMTKIELLICSIITPVTAFVGCLICNIIIKKYNVTTRTMLLIVNGLYILIPIYYLIGLSPDIDFGMKKSIEGYFIISYHGLIIGPIYSFYRVLFAEMLPKGKESEFFSFFHMVGKSSSWVGPLIVGAITNYTSSLRMGYTFVLASSIVSTVVIYYLDMHKAKFQLSDFEKVE